MSDRLPPLVRFLIFGTGLSKLANIMSMPFLAIFLSKSSDLSILSIGLIIALAPLMSVVASFLGGQFSDSVGRKGILLASIGAASLVFLGFFLAARLSGSPWQIPIFCVLNMSVGICTSVFQPVSQALMADLLPDKSRPRAFQLRYAAVNVGTAIGPIVGGWAGISATPYAFLFTGVIYGVYFLGLGWMLRNIPTRCGQAGLKKATFTSSFKAIGADVRLRYFIFGGMLYMTCYSQIESNLSQHLSAHLPNGIKIFALLLSINGVAVVVFQSLAYFLNDRLSSIQSLLIGASTFTVGLAVFALADVSVPLLILGMLIVSLGETFIGPVSNQFVDELAPPHLRGTYFGANVLRQLGLSIDPPLGGIVLQNFGGRVLFISAAVLSMVSAVVFLISGQDAPSEMARIIAAEDKSQRG